MAVEKLSVSLPDIVYARAKQAAEWEGVPLSTWLAQAAETAADLAEMRAAAEECEAMFGEPDPDEVAKVHAQLAEAGVGMPESPEAAAQRARAMARLFGDDTIG